MSAPFVIGSNVKIPVSATDKVIYLISATLASASSITLHESTTDLVYTVPVGRKLIILQYTVNVGHTNCATNWVKFHTSGGIAIQHFDVYHTNADAYVIDVAGFTEVSAGNTITFEDSNCGSTGQILGVETGV